MRLRPGRRAQRGAFAVETALALPVLIGVGLVGSDMQRIHTERGRVENAAGAMALNIAAQPQLTRAGVDALAEIALQGHEGAQQLWVMQVKASGQIGWVLQRGAARGLCTPPVAGTRYGGELPEPRPATGPNGEVTGADPALVVVLACRDTREIALTGGLVLPEVLQTTAIFRATAQAIRLDDALQAESAANGHAYSAT